MIAISAYAAEICRLYVLIVLAAASIGKLASLSDAAASVAELGPGLRRWARPLVLAVAGAEAAVALLLAAGGPYARPGMAGGLALFTAFGVAIAVALAKG